MDCTTERGSVAIETLKICLLMAMILGLFFTTQWKFTSSKVSTIHERITNEFAQSLMTTEEKKK